MLEPFAFAVSSASVSASACGSGYFQSETGQLGCIHCDSLGDFYQEQRGQSFCLHCPPNTQRYMGVLSAANRSSCQCNEGACEAPFSTVLAYRTRYWGVIAAAMLCAGYYSRDGRPGEVRYLPTFIYTTPVSLCCRLMISADSAGVHAMYSSTSISPFSPSDLGASHAHLPRSSSPVVQVLVASRARVVELTRRVPTVKLPLARWLCELVDSGHCRPV